MAFGTESIDMDCTLWGVLSGAQHGTWYALADGLRGQLLDLDPLDPLDPTGAVAPLVVTSENLTMFGVLCWQGCSAVAAARSELMGWSPTSDMITSSETIQAIAHDFVQHSRSKNAPPDL